MRPNCISSAAVLWKDVEWCVFLAIIMSERPMKDGQEMLRKLSFLPPILLVEKWAHLDELFNFESNEWAMQWVQNLISQ